MIPRQIVVAQRQDSADASCLPMPHASKDGKFAMPDSSHLERHTSIRLLALAIQRYFALRDRETDGESRDRANS